MKVSVLVLTYNQQESIARTLDSVLAQKTGFDFEVLIGEDASTDATRAICGEYTRRYPGKVRLMPPAPNKGLVRNYYDCMLAARGEYISDVAGDDFWTDTTKLQRQADALDAYPDAVLVHSSWCPYDENSKEIGAPVVSGHDGKQRGPDMLHAMLERRRPVPVHLCTAMYRRKVAVDIFNDNKGFLLAQTVEDYPLVCYLASHGDFIYQSAPTLAYGVGGGNRLSNPTALARRIKIQTDTLRLTLGLMQRLGVDPDREIKKGMDRAIRHGVGMAMQARGSVALQNFLNELRTMNLGVPLPTRVKMALIGRFFR